VFDGWVAWKSLCLTDEWLQTGIVATEVHNGFQALLAMVSAAMGGKYKETYNTPEDYIPGCAKKSRPGALRGKAMVNAFKSMCR